MPIYPPKPAPFSCVICGGDFPVKWGSPDRRVGDKWIRQVCGDNGRGAGRQAIAAVAAHIGVADYIAAANPDTVSMLIAELAAERAKVDRAQKALKIIADGKGKCGTCGVIAVGNGGGVTDCDCSYPVWTTLDPQDFAIAVLKGETP